MLTNLQMEKLRQFHDRRAQHVATGRKKSETKRKPRIFPLKGPQAAERKKTVSDFVVMGICTLGNQVSRMGFASSWDAHNYAAAKGWRDISVVTALH